VLRRPFAKVYDAMHPRDAEEADIDPLAKLWYEGWLDAHAEIVPAELKRLRTLESFRERLHRSLPNVRVLGRPGSPAGFHIVREAELYQLYVSRESRGAGVAATLIADAEARLSENGVQTAWLACALRTMRSGRAGISTAFGERRTRGSGSRQSDCVNREIRSGPDRKVVRLLQT
jgi:GNAT superfamily N-acetyltransferase